MKVCEWGSTRLKLSCGCLFGYPRYLNLGFGWNLVIILIYTRLDIREFISKKIKNKVPRSNQNSLSGRKIYGYCEVKFCEEINAKIKIECKNKPQILLKKSCMITCLLKREKETILQHDIYHRLWRHVKYVKFRRKHLKLF